VGTRKEWRLWLQNNHKSNDEIWLIYYRKESGRPSLPYDAAVEEALCFGWIDSIRKTIDDGKYAQRFSRRKHGSPYSQTNKERLAYLDNEGKLTEEVKLELKDNRPESYQIPEDILVSLKLNKEAWEFFQAASPSYQRIRAAYVDSARNRSGEFEKRLDNLIEKSAQGKQFGYHIEKFY
jgi:uncharacterized protein YdeI (YjbR/CyaY-like superfamily)